MAIKIDIQTLGLKESIKALKKFKGRSIITVTRQAINKTAKGVHVQAVKMIGTQIAIPAAELKSERFSRIDKARGSIINSLNASVTFDHTKAPSLIRFVKGSTDVEDQLGKTISGRDGVKVQVKKGKTTTLKGAFILKPNKGGNIVARRVRKGKGDKGIIHKQSAKTIAKIAEQLDVQGKLEPFIDRRFKIELNKAMRKQLVRAGLTQK